MRYSVTAMVFGALSAATATIDAADEEAPPPTIVVAEGEGFAPTGDDGWQVVGQEDSYATQTFGAMWVTHGGLIKAETGLEGAEARQTVRVPADGSYRVWSKYQAPPYFAYPHRIEIHQAGKKVFEYRYGDLDAERMWSFCGETTYGLPPVKQIWFTWGVDHDAAEAPKRVAQLKAGTAELRLFAETAKGGQRHGARCVDFVLLTTDHRDTCEGWGKHGQAKSPFMFEALKGTPVLMRFRNGGAKPAKAYLHTLFGHVTWHCAPKRGVFPESAAVKPGAWSPWFDINEILYLVTDEGLQISLVDAETPPKGRAKPEVLPGKVAVEFARSPGGRDPIGKMEIASGEVVHFPLDVIWNRERKLRRSTDLSAELIEKARGEWRKASPGKPKHIAFYGSFGRGGSDYALELKDALGYNTLLPEGKEVLPVDGYHQHLRNPEQIKTFAEGLGADRRRFRVCSFGDEINIGGIDPADPKYLEPFRAWLKAKRLTKEDLKADPAQATLTGNNRLKWYARQFGAEHRLARYREMTAVAKSAFGPQVLTGANYSPHHGVLYYGDHLQWIDAFKLGAMGMFWTEDYIFFAPELPQMMSFLMARAHCATKYRGQPIHMYVMPHSPGQPAEIFRRNSLLAVGAGAQHIDHFWVAPQEHYSENYVSWGSEDTFRAIFESIHDTAAAEPFLVGAKRRPARVAVVTGKATAINENLVAVDPARDPFLAGCHVAGKVVQNICRKDQQAIYIALRNAGYLVDLITEEDIVEGGILKSHDAVYLAGEWVGEKTVPALGAFVEGGGVLCASTGLGVYSEFGEPSAALGNLLGVKVKPPQKGLYHYRQLLELPLAEPVGEIDTGDGILGAIAFRQDLQPIGEEVEIIGRWADNGAAAVTRRKVGKGTVIGVGTALGASWLKTGLKPVPWARGGRVNLYHPEGFSEAADRLMRLGVESSVAPRDVVCSRENVEAWVLENAKGAAVTLINWTNEPRLKPLRVEIKLGFRPGSVRSVVAGDELPFRWEGGSLSLVTALDDADYLLIER